MVAVFSPVTWLVGGVVAVLVAWLALVVALIVGRPRAIEKIGKS